MSSTFLAVSLTIAGGAAEITGFVKLGAELRQARRAKEGPMTTVGQSWEQRYAILTADAVVVEEVPPPGDTLDSKLAHTMARLTNVEVLHEAATAGLLRDAKTAKAEIAYGKERAHVAEERLKELTAETQRADAAEAAARRWFVAGVILAMLGGVVSATGTS